jgi:hypothetical protein
VGSRIHNVPRPTVGSVRCQRAGGGAPAAGYFARGESATLFESRGEGGLGALVSGLGTQDGRMV